MLVHIIHKETGLALDLSYDKKHSLLRPFTSSETQHWHVERTEWGSLIFTNKVNGKALDCYKTVPILKRLDGSRSQQWYESIDGSWKNAKYNRRVQIKDYEVRTTKDKRKTRDTFALKKCFHEDEASD